jgi:hypothetical protein
MTGVDQRCFFASSLSGGRSGTQIEKDTKSVQKMKKAACSRAQSAPRSAVVV